jgi:hypothetical protein
MPSVLSPVQAHDTFFPHAFHYQPQPQPSDDIPIASARHYRNDVVCRLLCLRDRVHEDDIPAYWEIIDEMLRLTTKSAIQLLQNLYEYRVRKLPFHESLRNYPQITNALYRLEYEDDPGGFRDVCAGALLKEAIDLLQEEADRLIRER